MGEFAYHYVGEALGTMESSKQGRFMQVSHKGQTHVLKVLKVPWINERHLNCNCNAMDAGTSPPIQSPIIIYASR